MKRHADNSTADPSCSVSPLSRHRFLPPPPPLRIHSLTPRFPSLVLPWPLSPALSHSSCLLACATLSPRIRACLPTRGSPQVYHNLNKASQEIWLKNRFSSDQSKLDAFLAFPNDPARVSEQIEKARTRLQTIEDLLAYQQTQGSGWLVGDKPSHADALVFGFYVFQALSPQVKKELWEHESLPLTRAWVDKVKGLVSADSLP